jgi:anti-anti-sigma regulatory factor
MSPDRATTVVVDVSEMSYIGTAGLAELIRARARLHVVLRGVQPQFRRLLELTHLAGVFDVTGRAPGACLWRSAPDPGM